MIRPSEFSNRLLILGSYPPTENGRQGLIFLDDYISKRMVPKSLGKDIPGFQNWQEARDLHLIGSEKDSIIESFYNKKVRDLLYPGLPELGPI